MNKKTITYSLRDYQAQTVDQIKNNFYLGKNKTITQLPTGAGKGLIMSHITNEAINKNKKVLTVLFGTSLIEQTINNYKKYHDIDSGVVQGRRKEFDSQSTIASISTIARMKDLDFSDIDLLIVDEAHNTTSNSYGRLFKAISPKTYAIGFTATPYAIGNRFLPFWDSFVRGATYTELKDKGHLVPFKYWAPKGQIDTSGLSRSAGDYNSKELFGRASEKYIIGDVIETYKEKGENKPAILFAVNTEHSKLMAKEFNKAGIPAVHADADTPQEQRELEIERLKKGEIQILCNVNIFSVGVDIPEATVCILARPTMSAVLHHQQVGRVLRPAKGKEYAIFLDHSSNYSRHGVVGAEMEPQLEFMKPRVNKKTKIKKEQSLKLCPECRSVVNANVVTCECGYKFRASNDITKKFRDGELVELGNIDNKHQGILSSYIRYKQLQQHFGRKPNWVFFQLAKNFPLQLMLEALGGSMNKWVIDKIREEQIRKGRF